MKAILVIIVLLLILAGVIVYLIKQGKIKDEDGDLIPDVIEDTVEEVKVRTKRVVEEVKDVVEEVKDVADAVKGKKRRGRKPKNKK